MTYVYPNSGLDSAGVNTLPAVDIVIAARHEQKHLGSCLSALANQNYPKKLINIWIVDNSDDNETILVAQKYDVHIIKCGIARASAARNMGVRAGNAELVAFLDAHCLPDQNWLNTLVSSFISERIGGCQGTLEFKYDSSLLQLLLGHSAAEQQQELLLLGLKGKRSAYPYAITGNAIFRRQAIEQAGLFDEKLRYLEDVDLSWRIVLLGYELTNAEEASAVHIAHYSPLSYFKKVFEEGRSVARLLSCYQVEKTHINNRFFTGGLPFSLSELSRFFGFCAESFRLSVSAECRPGRYAYKPVDKHFRSPVGWTAEEEVTLSSQVIFWQSEVDESIIVHIGTNTRYAIDGTANSFFRALADGMSRDSTIKQMIESYNISPEILSRDLDAFIAGLIEEGIAVCKKNSPA